MRPLLAECLASGLPDQWRDLLASLRTVIASATTRSARQFGPADPALIEDLIQDAYVRLCHDDYRAMRTLRANEAGSIYALAQAAAVTATLDHFRSITAQKRGSGQRSVSIDSLLATADEPTAAEGAERAVLMREIDERLRAATPPATRDRDRRIFWLYYRHGLTANDIARLRPLGLSAKGVESTLRRLTGELRQFFSPARERSHSEGGGA